MAGIPGIETKLRRCEREGRRVFRTGAESMRARQQRKLMGAKSWYKVRKRKTMEDGENDSLDEVFGGNRPKRRKIDREDEKKKKG